MSDYHEPTIPVVPIDIPDLLAERDQLQALNQEIKAEIARISADKTYLTRAGLANEWEERYQTQERRLEMANESNRIAVEGLKGGATRIAELVAALRKYGCHLEGCSYGVADLAEPDKRGECDCGFEATLNPPAGEPKP